MSEALDSASVLFAGVVVGLVGSLLLLRRGVPGIDRGQAAAVPLVWIAAALVQAVASFGNAFRGQLPPVLVFAGVNALQLLALNLLWLGARRMAERVAPGWMAALAPAGWLVACLVPGFLDSQSGRFAWFGLLACGLLGWTTTELLAVHRRRHLRAVLDLAAMAGLVTLSLIWLFLALLVAPRHPDGVWAPVTAVTALIVALLGTTPPFLILNIRSERERAEEGRRLQALEAGRAEVQRLHEGLPAIIFLRAVDPDGNSRLLYRGGDLERVTGWPAAQLHDRSSLRFLSEAEDRSLAEHFQAVLRDGAAVDVWRMRQPDGTARMMRTRSRVLRRRPDGSAEVVGYVLDITAERLAEACAMAAARLASLGEMGTGLAHEIKQPLQVLSLAADTAAIAAQRGDTTLLMRKLDVIAKQAERAAGIVEHLRRFARGMPAEARPGPISLAAPVEGALRFAAARLQEVGVEVEVSLGIPPPIVVAEVTAVEQVLLTLLSNARDALAELPEGKPRRVRIAAAEAGNGTVDVEVADTGGGIAPDMLPRLFEPFVTTKGHERGLGLGLATSYGLIRSLGGEIAARNAAEGAIFTVRLPGVPRQDGAPGSGDRPAAASADAARAVHGTSGA